MPATLEVTTTRRTSSAAAASTTMRGDSALTSQTRSAGREATYPAAWNTVSQPRNARRSAGAIQDIGADRLDLDGAEAVEAGLVPVGHAYRAERLATQVLPGARR